MAQSRAEQSVLDFRREITGVLDANNSLRDLVDEALNTDLPTRWAALPASFWQGQGITAQQLIDAGLQVKALLEYLRPPNDPDPTHRKDLKMIQVRN